MQEILPYHIQVCHSNNKNKNHNIHSPEQPLQKRYTYCVSSIACGKNVWTMMYNNYNKSSQLPHNYNAYVYILIKKFFFNFSFDQSLYALVYI